jgi:hypothetical protein
MDNDFNQYMVHRVEMPMKARPAFRAYEQQIIAKLQGRSEKIYLLVELLLHIMEAHPTSSPSDIEKLLISSPPDLSTIFNDI